MVFLQWDALLGQDLHPLCLTAEPGFSRQGQVHRVGYFYPCNVKADESRFGFDLGRSS